MYFAKLAGFTVTPIIFSRSGKRNKIPKLSEMQKEHDLLVYIRVVPEVGSTIVC